MREIIEDYNKRVLADRLRPAVGNLPPMIAKTLDVDDMVARWRALRAEREERAAGARVTGSSRCGAAPPPARARAPWWRRLFGVTRADRPRLTALPKRPCGVSRSREP